MSEQTASVAKSSERRSRSIDVRDQGWLNQFTNDACCANWNCVRFRLQTQKIVRVEYKGLVFREPLRFDLLVADCLLVELKAVEVLHPSSEARFLATWSYLIFRSDCSSTFMNRFSKTAFLGWFSPERIKQSEATMPKFRYRIRIWKNLRSLRCLL